MKNIKDKLFILFSCSLCLFIAISIPIYVNHVSHHKFEDKIQEKVQTLFHFIHKASSSIQNILPQQFHYSKEGMTNNTGREKVKVVCLGDSIFQNKDYVGINDSVQDNLTNMLSKTNSTGLVLAEDNAQMESVDSQIKTLEDMKDWGGSNDYIFLSIGGNDILNNYKPLTEHDDLTAFTLVKHKRDEANKMFRKYIKVVKNIHKKFPSAKIILSTIYYPQEENYKKYHNVIKYWNQSVIDYSKFHPKQVSGVLRTDKLVKEPEDFTHFIEPSANGSKKIVDGIKKIIF